MEAWYNNATANFHTFRKPKFMTTFTAQLTQYVLPSGFAKPVETDLPIEVEPLYKQMQRANCRLECEVLTTSEVSITVTHSKDKLDIDCSVTANGPAVQAGIIEMLKRKPWNTHLLGQLRELGGTYETLMRERGDTEEGIIDDGRSIESIDEDIDELLDCAMTIARTLNDIGE